MNDSLSEKLVEQLRTHKAAPRHETLAVRLPRDLLVVLIKYRGRVVGEDGKTKAEAWGAVVEKLVRVADELLELRAAQQRGQKAE